MIHRTTLVALVVTLGPASPSWAESFDQVLFDPAVPVSPRGDKPAETWRLNIWGRNADGQKGAGGIEVVPGRRGGNALRFHTTNAGKYNFVAPTIPDGPWREKPYHAVAVWYRGDGTKTNLTFQLQTHGPDGGRHSYSGRLFLGSTEWRRVVLKSFWRRQGTPPLDLSRVVGIHVGGSGTHEVTLGEVRLLAGRKNVHLEQRRPGKQKLDSPVRAVVSQPELTVIREGLHLCRLTIENDEPKPLAAVVDVEVFGPGEQTGQAFHSRSTVSGGGVETVNVPLRLKSLRDGLHRLTLAVRDDLQRTIRRSEYQFHVSTPRELKYADIVLWPPPQVWQPGTDTWRLPETCRLHLDGKGDSFPLEHLAEQLKKRYGIEAIPPANGVPDIQLEYVADKVRPEGFLLDVDAQGVRLRAGSGRGMYYGVRALLDLICQSGMGEAAAQCRHVHCEDWPQTPLRVLYHRIDNFYRGPRSVRAYKDFIYDQVAGGRFNLLILNCRGAVAYESHPELAMRNAFRKEQLGEILDFARRHYVDVAPGGNSPGHADWIVRRKPELAEDGDKSTLCTRHPDALPLLLDVYGELIELFGPTKYFHLGGDEVRWKTAVVPSEKRCPICRGVEKRQLLLEHWKAQIEFCRKKGLKPIIWEDMLSEQWNGGAPHHIARILPQLPKDVIVASWSVGNLVNPPILYRDLGLTAWKINTSFAPGKMDDLQSWHRDYQALGIAVFMPWPWCNFLHSPYERLCSYSTPAIHCCAACNWKPQTAAQGWHEMVAAQGQHWMKVMQVTEWGTRQIRYQPVLIDGACNNSTRDAKQGDGTGWMDLGGQRDLRSLAGGRVVVGAVPFVRPDADNDCITLRAKESSQPVKIGKRVRGLAFLHTAAAGKKEIGQLQTRFFRKNTADYGMPVAHYIMHYADGKQTKIPIKLGWHVHFWDCYPPARVMPGARAFWTGFTAEAKQRDPKTSDACLWTMEWKNPRPDTPVDHVTFAAADTEATIAILGVTAVE